MSLAWPVKEKGRPVMAEHSHVTVVVPWAKWAWRWPTSGASASRSASATACSSSLAYSLRGQPKRSLRARTAWANAIALARARPAGCRRAVRRSAGRKTGRFSRSQARSVVALRLVVSGRYSRVARMRSTTGCVSASSGGLMTYRRSGWPVCSTRCTSLAMKSSEIRGQPFRTYATVLRSGIDRLQEGAQPRGAAVELEVGLDAGAGLAAEALAHVGLVDEELERAGERRRVAGRDEDAGAPVDDRARDGADIARHDRAAARHRLEDHVRKAVAVALRVG